MTRLDYVFRRRAGLPGLALATVLIPAIFLSGEVRAQGSMKDMPAMGDKGDKKQTTASGTGTVVAVNAANKKVTLDHGPMPALKWPAMKMEFAAAPSVDLSKVKVGDKVNFTLSGSGNSYTVQSVSPAR
jgi:Cu/Ag efflux protein CusF